jgi:hypothetical protein
MLPKRLEMRLPRPPASVVYRSRLARRDSALLARAQARDLSVSEDSEDRLAEIGRTLKRPDTKNKSSQAPSETTSESRRRLP